MSNKTLTFLTILLLALGAYVYFVELPEAEKEIAELQQQEEKRKIFNGSRESLKEISLENEYVSLKVKKDSTWFFTEPIQDWADYSNFDRIIGFLLDHKIERTIPDSTLNLKEIGLEPPLVTIQFGYEDGTSEKIELGIGTPTKEFCYARKNGSKELILVTSELLKASRRNLYYFRFKGILTFSPTDADEISILTKKEKFTIEKDSLQLWYITSPYKATARSELIHSKILAQIFSMRAVDFGASNPGKNLGAFGLDKPSYTIILKKGGEVLDKIFFGKKRENLVYVNTESHQGIRLIYNAFLENYKNFYQYRDSKLQEFDRDSIDKIQFTFGNQEIILAKQEEAWSMAKPLQKLVTSLNEPQGILNMLYYTEIETLSPISKTKLREEKFKQETKVELWSNDEKVFDVDFWFNGEKVFAKSNSQEFIAQIKALKGYIQVLKPKLSAFVVE